MKNLYSYLATKNITIKDFEDKAAILLENHDLFIPFAIQDIMVEYNLPSDCEIDVSIVLAEKLKRYYTFAK